MSKRLILALVAVGAIMLVAGPAFAAVQNVKVSGDLEIMPLGRYSFDLKPRTGRGENYENAILSFLRLRVDADLTDNVSVTTRFLNERDWESAADLDNNVELDLAYVTLKEFLYSPLTLTLGRQELHMGSEMVVGDPDTNNTALGNLTVGVSGQPDLSKQKSFDAMRATLDYSPLIIDAIYAKMAEGDHSLDLDQTLYGLDANYDLDDRWDSMLEAYYYLRIIGKEANTTINEADSLNTVGGRIISHPIENLVASLEGAFQFGQDVANDRTAEYRGWAVEAGATYSWPKARYTPTLTGLYAFFRGDDPDWSAVSSNSNTAWQPMYENQKYGDIANALLGQTNIHVFGAIGTAKVAEDIMAKLSFYSYFWSKGYGANPTLGTINTIIATAHDADAQLAPDLVMSDDRFVGNEIDLNLTYDYTEDVQFGLTTGAFIPGEAFEGENNSIASQAIGSMLVRF